MSENTTLAFLLQYTVTLNCEDTVPVSADWSTALSHVPLPQELSEETVPEILRVLAGWSCEKILWLDTK